jgi:hypothetical protein
MAADNWSRDPQAAGRRPNLMNADAQARLSFAIECVDALHYLVDLDDHLIPNDVATEVLGHGWQVVDIAHVRWAAATAITALDLCAAALGRLYCGMSGWDLSVEKAARNKTHWKTLAAHEQASGWITAVRGDHRYNELLQLRHALTHSVRPRSYIVHLADVSLTSDFATVGAPSAERLREHLDAHARAQAEAEARAEAATFNDVPGSRSDLRSSQPRWSSA